MRWEYLVISDSSFLDSDEDPDDWIGDNLNQYGING
jgi:hypothetical protein